MFQLSTEARGISSLGSRFRQLWRRKRRFSKIIVPIGISTRIAELRISHESLIWLELSKCNSSHMLTPSQILMMHIKNTLPEIKQRISTSLAKYTAELQTLGDSMLGNNTNIILSVITEFCNEYRTVLEGNNQELSSIELSG